MIIIQGLDLVRFLHPYSTGLPGLASGRMARIARFAGKLYASASLWTHILVHLMDRKPLKEENQQEKKEKMADLCFNTTISQRLLNQEDENTKKLIRESVLKKMKGNIPNMMQAN